MDQDITELVSESDSDEHSPGDISAHSDGNIDYVTDTHCTRTEIHTVNLLYLQSIVL